MTVRLLRILALIAAVAGAAGSIALMLRAAHPHVVVLVMFVGWVLAPLLAFLALDLRGKGGAALYLAMLVITVGSLLIYRLVVLHPLAKPAAPFLMVPLGSLVLLAITAAVSRRTTG